MTAINRSSQECTPPFSPYALSDEQVRFFDEHGYLILRNWVTGELLERLQAAGTRWIERGLADGGANRDHLFAEREVGRVMWRVKMICPKTYCV